MKNLLKKTTLIAILLTSLYSNEFLENSFIEASMGYSKSPYNKKDLNGSINITKLDEKGYLYDFAIGYKLNKSIFATLNYQYSKLNDIDFDEYYLTLNYQSNYKLNPYIGVVIGKSFLHWNKEPLNSSQNIDWTSGSFMYGMQVGLEYKVNKRISLISRYIYSRTEHGTNIRSLPAESYIEHDSKSQILLGFRYLF